VVGGPLFLYVDGCGGKWGILGQQINGAINGVTWES
jgi:hypothetical protein